MKNSLSQSIRKLTFLSKAGSAEKYKPTENDVYLVSYPRSGNTWMRVIMSELLYHKSGDSIEELQNYVPDIHQPIFTKDLIKSNFHVIKSHYPYVVNNNIKNRASVKNYKKVVYIVRDPRDILISHYKYLNNFRYSINFDKFIWDWITGRIWPCSWQEHVNSWIGMGYENIGVEIELIKYEDLLLNPEPEIMKLSTIMGIQFTSEDVQRALQAAAVEKMRSKETKGMPRHERQEKAQFIGEATNKQWLEKLTAEQLNLIEEYLGHTMKRCGYTVN
ncbi:sulfotransferase domain-containing protein [Okeanomitos corallinicola TIOX110]|uniref:Sulfotransferase domain-containing protein n=1 Tax=Okeanomitos corallinicola TIOX110 TaxID=3133117 RepID=A0ABZ2UP67_9CYAN